MRRGVVNLVRELNALIAQFDQKLGANLELPQRRTQSRVDQAQRLCVRLFDLETLSLGAQAMVKPAFERQADFEAPRQRGFLDQFLPTVLEPDRNQPPLTVNRDPIAPVLEGTRVGHSSTTSLARALKNRCRRSIIGDEDLPETHRIIARISMVMGNWWARTSIRLEWGVSFTFTPKIDDWGHLNTFTPKIVFHCLFHVRIKSCFPIKIP